MRESGVPDRTTVAYKIFAKIINKQLDLYVENVSDEHQKGFRLGRSTISATG